MGWEIRVLPLSMDLILEPDHLDAEFSAGRIGTPMYWEGAVTVSGERDGQAVSGRGFVEMVGYDR
jgi:predicted secreted hydrolase